MCIHFAYTLCTSLPDKVVCTKLVNSVELTKQWNYTKEWILPLAHVLSILGTYKYVDIPIDHSLTVIDEALDNVCRVGGQ
jgi:hypothetical protein